MVGQTVSHYRIVELLGGGGMGVVYKAIDLRLNRAVALKFLAPELTRDAEANERFRHEAQSASALDHGNICTIHEIDETPDHRLFLAMAFYEGQTLKKQIEQGPLPVDGALDVAIQIAQGLSRAHQSGLVHRDIKPANVMLTADGLVKIVDFGLAKLTGDVDMTRTGTTLGTVAYMSPEQARGGQVDARTDVWALAVVLYEMLAGSRPFTGKDEVAVLASILDHTPAAIGSVRQGVPPDLQRIVAKALDKNAAARYRSATELLADLTACRAAMSATAPGSADFLRVLRRPVVAIPAVIVLLLAAVPAVFAYRRAARATWAREEGIPQIERLVRADDFRAAFAVARQVEAIVPDDPVLATLWPQFSADATLITDPEGAEVFAQDYSASENEWERIGSTPLEKVRLPRGVFRLRIEKDGFEPTLLATRNPSALLRNAVNRLAAPILIALTPKGTAPEMLPVPGGSFPVTLSGFNTDALVALEPFFIDRHEVTNKTFKEFVDRGRYANAEYWEGLPFVENGHELSWQEAVQRFRDSTDRPGPAAWEVGRYPAGQDNYPVAGVSWYEAAAFCRSQGKALPTVFHWARAALAPDEIFSPLAPAIIPASNFGKSGPAIVGEFHGVGPYGTYDMGGNVREWIWNDAPNGRRWILGGAWNDPEWMLINRNSMAPFDRSPSNGFRCARYEQATQPEEILARVEFRTRDYQSATPVSDEVFNVFKRQYACARSPLNERLEASEANNANWIREKISLDAGYENSRITAYLFVPRSARPPYQTLIAFPGLSAFAGRANSDNIQPGLVDFIVTSGRALIYPVWKGSYERWDSFLNLHGEESSRAVRTQMIHWRQELGSIIDLLAARSDIDAEQIAYLGISFGASMALPLLALEPRLKTAVLLAPGFTYREAPPEADALNFASRITMPILMIGGRHDYVLSLEEAQKPLFARLGTLADSKRHVVLDAGHVNFPRSDLIREVLGWLDKYLGPVATSTATP